MEYRPIELNEWTRTGEGASACSYVNKKDDSFMLKLFNKNIKLSIIEKEYEMAKTIMELQIPTPKVHEIVKCKDKYGIIFENIKNKKSITRWLEIDLDKYIKIFADEARKLHSMKADISKLKSQKELIKNMVTKIEGLTNEEREKFLEIIDNTEETNTCIHGDLSTGNLIVASDKPHWIDLADFAYGNPLFDIGMLYFDCKSEIFTLFRKILYKTSIERLNHIWDIFIREYLKTNDENAIKDYEKKIRPYAALSVYNWVAKSDMPGFISKYLVKKVAKAFLQ